MPTGSYRPAHTLSVLTVALLCAGVAVPVFAASEAPAARQQSGTYTFTIAQQPLVAALNNFTQVTGWQVGMSSALVDGIASPGVTGALVPEKALDRLLLGTGLSYRKMGANSIVLERASTPAVALQQITVSATRQAEDISRVPGIVTVKARETLDRQNVNSIRDIVHDEPGVSVGGAGQRSGTTGYNIRGIDGNRVLTQIDGVEVPDNFFYGPYAQTQRNYVDPEIIKRVEILRGPASVLYGSNAIGGAVSYYTLDPEDIIKPGQDHGARLKTGYSSADDSWLKSGTIAGRLNDFDALLHLSQRTGHETESYGETGGTGLGRTAANPEDARTTNVLAKLGWNYADDARIALTYERYKGERETDQKSAVGGPFGNGRGFGFYRSRDTDDTVSRERFGIEHNFDLDSLLADHVKWSLNYQVAKTDEKTSEIYAPSRVVLRTRETKYEDKQWVFDTQLEKAFAIASTDHQLTYGATIKSDKVSDMRTGSAICQTVLLPNCPVAGQPSLATGDNLTPSSDFPDPTVNTYSLFAQDQISWNNWTFLPGARYDYTEMKPHITDAYLAGAGSAAGDSINDKSKHWHKISPKLGVTYAFNDHYTWYGQYAEGFRTPTAKMLFGRYSNPTVGYEVAPNPDLEPETSKSYETGLRGQFDAGNFDVTAFYNTYRDFIDENSVAAGFDETTYRAANISRAKIHGFEAKGRLNLDQFGAAEGLYALGSLAYARGVNQDTGQPLNTVNPLKSVFGLGYERERYGALLNWTLVKAKNRVDSDEFHTPDGTSSQFKTPGFGIIDLAGYYKITKDLTVNAGLYNLTNKKYWLWDDVRGYDSVGEASATQPANLDRLTQPGRNFAVNLVWDL
jgi:hemoglobin/transferrin/lactoferrin receptor protein